MSKQIVSGPDALTKLLSGVNLIANSVKATLGPSGKNCVYERLGNNLPVSTRDGVTVAEQIDSEDPFERMGINLIKGVAREAVDSSGDGTTTATLLAQAIFAEGVKAVTVGANPVALKRGIEKATEAVVASLKSMAVAVSGDGIRQVATISANNDEFLGELIARAVTASGDDGVVTVEISRTAESTLEIVDGLQIGTGYLSTAFITDAARAESSLENVSVFLHEKRLATIKPMLPFLQQLATEGRSLLVIAEDVTDEALAVLSIASQKGTLRCVAVKTPGGPEHLADIAALTGARVVTELSGAKLAEIDQSWLGHAAKVITKSQSTTIISDGDERESLARRKQELRTQVSEASEEGSRLRLQARLARLAGGIAIIRVGAKTELEMLVKKDALEDAMHATRGAVSEGILPGGGTALLHALDVSKLNLEDDEAIGARIVARACQAPLKTLAENGGESPEYVLKQVLLGDTNHFGWNAKTNQYTDLVQAGIIDPLRVVRVAIESAASISGTMLITHCLVANPREK